MSAEQAWKLAMAGVPAARRELFAELKTKLSVVIGSPMRETETTLRILLDKRFEAGSRVVGNLNYEWRLARLPFYVEWKIKKNDGHVHDTVFLSASRYLNSTAEDRFVTVANLVIDRRIIVEEQLENTARDARGILRDSSVLGLANVVALAKMKQAKERQMWEANVIEYLTDKGYGKHDLGNINLALSQALAELCNAGKTGSEYLALSWDEYSKEKDMKQTRADWADLPTSLRYLFTTPPDLPTPSSASTSAPSDGAEAAKKKRKRNKRKKKTTTTIKEQLQGESNEANTAAHHDDSSEDESPDNVDDAPEDPDSTVESMMKAVETIDWASEVPNSPYKISKSHVDTFAANQPVSMSTDSASLEEGGQSITPRQTLGTSLIPTDQQLLDSSINLSSGETESPALLSASLHINSIVPDRQQGHSLPVISSTSAESSLPDQSFPQESISDEMPRLKLVSKSAGIAKHNANDNDHDDEAQSIAKPKAWSGSTANQAPPAKHSPSFLTDFPSLSPSQRSPTLPTITTPISSISSLDHQDKGTKSPASPLKVASAPSESALSKKDSESKATSTTVPSSSRQRTLVAVPDLKFFAKPKRAASGDREAAASDKTKTEPVASKGAAVVPEPTVAKEAEVGKEAKRQISSGRHHASSLRPEAPEFTPSMSQSGFSSAFTSPEMVPLGSVPMSMTTSATTNTSAEVESTRQAGSGKEIVPRKGLDVDFTLSSTSIEEPPAAAQQDKRPPQDDILKDLDKPWPNSTSMDLEEDDDDGSVLIDQVLQTWPSSDKVDLMNVTPWRYAKFGVESPEEIIMKHGHHDNNYAVDPWHTTIRQEASQANNIPLDVPAVLMKTKSGFPLATGQFDAVNNVWRIFPPSSHPGADLRELDDHPDYLESAKLLEVQGYEMFYYNVYVAIRLSHTCRYEKCKKETVDSLPMTQVCSGCGPLAPVRYCSISCLFEDLPSHWKECGSSKFWPPSNQVIDPDISFPAKFNNLLPMIKDISGWDSMARRRIHSVARFLDGDYALFPEDSMRIVEIRTREHCSEEIHRRISRLLYCALLDHRNTTLIAYLYLLLRDALYSQIGVRYGEYPVVLRLQFMHEWKKDTKGDLGFRYLDSINSCDCMWFGTANSTSCTSKDGHESTCKAGAGLPGPHHETGLKGLVEQLEREHWILRAWQTKHASISDWRARVYGKGFNGVKPRKFKDVLPVLGVGFEGHISKDRVVGDWRPRLRLEATPPKARLVRGHWKQNPDSFVWHEPEEK